MTLNCEKINLQKGSKGDQVKQAQEILKKLGYYNGILDGDYGDLTIEAVRKYQRSKGTLAVDGIIGPVTCKHLNKEDKETTETLKKGSKGEQVKKLQNKLKQLGYYNAETDGDYGTKTVNAVKTYQTYYNLVNDGICGPITQKAINNTKTLTETNISKKLGKATGINIKDHGTLYQAALKKGKYSYYNNDIYTYTQEVNRVCNGSGINCTDWAQLGMWTLIDMGFPRDQIRIVRGVVTCNSGKGFGHVWLQLYLNGAWVNYDLSAAAAHGYGIGRLICTRGYTVTNINPAWAVSDDGIT